MHAAQISEYFFGRVRCEAICIDSREHVLD